MPVFDLCFAPIGLGNRARLPSPQSSRVGVSFRDESADRVAIRRRVRLTGREMEAVELAVSGGFE